MALNMSAAEQLARAAEDFKRLALRPCLRAPAAFAFLDPDRTPDPLETIHDLPAGVGVVWRDFGRSAWRSRTGRAVALCRAQARPMLMGADVARALELRIGLHAPERRVETIRRYRLAGGSGLATAAAHSPAGLIRARCAGADLAFLSPAFPSRSPSVKDRPILGAQAWARWAATVPMPVYALGGVTAQTVGALRAGPVAGLAAIDGFATETA
ncbi:MAG: thiamine phosphate synthase [Maricaulaceae bacterium]